MGNLDAQLLIDLRDSFFREHGGWATSGLMSTATDMRSPVVTGSTVYAILDIEKVEGGSSQPTAWVRRTATTPLFDGAYEGRMITFGARTYRIANAIPRDDGLVYECLLEDRT